jgi:hypothetical protein
MRFYTFSFLSELARNQKNKRRSSKVLKCGSEEKEVRIPAFVSLLRDEGGNSDFWLKNIEL